MNELYEKSDDIEAASEKHQSALKNVQRDFESKRHQLEELKNIQKTRLRKLQRDYPDTVKLHEYIDENKDQFEGRVYGPVVLMMNLKDARYAALVEQAMGGPRSFIFRAFICEKQSDYKKLTAYAIDKQQWKVRIQWSPTNEGDSRTPISTEELRSRFKLDYFVSDLIECPTIVHRALCQDSNINLIPVALQGVNPAQIASSGIFRKFVVGQTFYNVKTSNYGKRSKQITTSAIRNEYWLGESIDLDAKNALLESLKQLQSNKHDLDVQLEKLGSKLDQIKRELEQKKDEKKVLQNEKREIQIAEQRYNKNRDRLVRLKHDLEELRQKPEEDKRKIDELEREIKQMNEHEESLLAECEECLGKVIDYHKTMILASINYLHCSTKHTSVKQFAKQHSKDLEAAEREMNNIKVHYANANNDVKRHMQHCRDAGQGLPDELTEKWKEIVQIWKAEGLPITLEDLENKIAVQQGKKDGMRFANPHAMEHYEERKKEIQRLEEKIDKNKQVLDELKAKIDGLKNQWAPMIHSLVERINEKFTAAFQRIRCVGAVSVAEDPDFDKWGINIHVKFRENEKLQLLTGQRQSGGERSVTTILYLMSLQDLAKSPFRVVDEINQGMDPRNERMIHEQIVKGASRPGTSQYFLITPKLLPDLYYNERMRVLCIYNGEWLPDKMKPLSHYLENARQIAQA
ncbi:P-loop containing nucleoside triphosphate hydrolase protein [Mycotypha africana]|uniref:P-loop containing nucleoside triphosphate hydrolase protein n=1 Tax=Mycotypha africana TaxID=64632 RepID=UPI0023012632|nr:P-loop containing nucleoside triphosphate hydrolase protein [Mycotypha africana]KAI8988303.1 P-loop containing nucleoside triphosphate hydrolase protein [Mycotypha africana]